jgi:hypothetical protein
MTKKQIPTVGKMEGGVVIGEIKAGRDVVVGNQYNALQQQVEQAASPQEFVAKAKEVQKQVAVLKEEPGLSPSQLRLLGAVEGDMQDIIDETAKPKPAGGQIKATLNTAKGTMDQLAESIKSAVGLGAVIGGLAQVAIKLFKG